MNVQHYKRPAQAGMMQEAATHLALSLRMSSSSDSLELSSRVLHCICNMMTRIKVCTAIRKALFARTVLINDSTAQITPSFNLAQDTLFGGPQCMCMGCGNSLALQSSEQRVARPAKL